MITISFIIYCINYANFIIIIEGPRTAGPSWGQPGTYKPGSNVKCQTSFLTIYYCNLKLMNNKLLIYYNLNI